MIGDPNYREGFGKNATGGASKPTYVVTSSAATGAGSLYAAFQPGDHAHDINIVFAVPTVTIPSSIYIGSNVTIDGMANGMNGVTMDATANAKRAWIIEDPASNIVIRGINFRSTGTPNSGVAEFDLITVDGTNGSAISNLFIDRCTFVQASDGALDITGNVSNVTVQRSLFYGNAITMLVKYGARSNISLHHNVYTHNGERNPQAKGNMQLLDYVNNIIYLNDVPNYPDGTPTSPYGVRIWSANATSESPGNVVANIVGNAFIGSGTRIQLIADSGASLDGVYIDQTGAYYAPASNGAASPKAMPNAIPTEFAVTTLSMDELQSKLLPIVGAPNRTPLDQQRVDDVAAALPSL